MQGWGGSFSFSEKQGKQDETERTFTTVDNRGDRQRERETPDIHNEAGRHLNSKQTYTSLYSYASEVFNGIKMYYQPLILTLTLKPSLYPINRALNWSGPAKKIPTLLVERLFWYPMKQVNTRTDQHIFTFKW